MLKEVITPTSAALVHFERIGLSSFRARIVGSPADPIQDSDERRLTRRVKLLVERMVQPD